MSRHADDAETHFESDFHPLNVAADGRAAHALEYIAYQLGAIKVELREINERERNRPRD